MKQADPKKVTTTEQASEIQSLMTLSGWSVSELADRAGLGASTLKKALKGSYELRAASMDALRYAVASDRNEVAHAGAPPLFTMSDRDLTDKLTAIYKRGKPEHLSLLKDLVDIVYGRVTNWTAVTSAPTKKPDPIIKFPQGHLLRPVLGRIAAGLPQEAIQQAEEWIAIPPRIAKEVDYVLKVSGDSMIDKQIYDGDLVYMNLKREPRDGSIVAALCDHETCLKTYVSKAGGPPFLKAENKAFPPEIHPVDEMVIQGVCVGKHGLL